jgi:transposase
MESLPFLSSELSRITRQLERTMIELRSEMSIKAVADYFEVDWRLVKRVEKTHLQKKYSTIRLADVKLVGIDEIYVGYKRYKTIVRDLESGAVLHVGEGKGGEALEGFAKRLAHSRASIETIAMDMAQGYGKWARETLPEATIVYDHFHLIKLMNEKVDKVRRKTVNELEEDERKALKKNATFS